MDKNLDHYFSYSVHYMVARKTPPIRSVLLLQYTKKEADKLSLAGWVMNSHDGSVVGTVQGPEDKVKEM